MRSGRLNWCFLAGLAVAFDSALLAQTAPVPSPSETAPVEPAAETVRVSGEVPSPLSLTRADLNKLPRAEVHAKGRDGKDVLFSGFPLAEVLGVAGLVFPPGAMPSRGAVASYVLVEARDGYKAAFALAEIDPTLSAGTVLLADTKDGQPLSAAEGPFRVVVPGDKRPARWVREVTVISVHRG